MLPYRRRRIFISILMICAAVAFLLTATIDDRSAAAVKTQSQPGAPHAENDVAKISEAWAKEWSVRSLEPLVALYTDDAVFVTATGTRVTGRVAIRDLFSKALALSASKVQVASRGTEQSGDLAYDSGEYEETTTIGQVTRKGRGNYLVVLRRDGKKQWRIVQHMWTDIPMTGQ